MFNMKFFANRYKVLQTRSLQVFLDLYEEVNKKEVELPEYGYLFENPMEKVYIDLSDDLMDDVEPQLATKNQAHKPLAEYYAKTNSA
jgi:hypothetical protein